MPIDNKRTALATAIYLALSQTSNADIISVSDNLPDPSYITGTQAGQFDLLPFLIPSDDFQSPYQINGAAILFNFDDDSDDTTSSTFTRYEGGSHYGRTYERTTTTENEYESVELGIAGASFEEETDYYDTGTVFDGTSNQYAGSHWDGSCWSSRWGGGCSGGSHSVYNTYHDYVQDLGWTGEFLIAEALDLNSLGTLLTTGLLDFTITVNGDINLVNAQLVVDIDRNPAQDQNRLQVSEPGTFGIMMLGLAGLVGANRRRKPTLKEP